MALSAGQEPRPCPPRLGRKRTADRHGRRLHPVVADAAGLDPITADATSAALHALRDKRVRPQPVARVRTDRRTRELRGPPAQGGALCSAKRLFKPSVDALRDAGDRFWGQVAGASGNGWLESRQQKRPFAGLFGSPLTDSNRRPPPYHGGALPAELRGQAPYCSRFARRVRLRDQSGWVTASGGPRTLRSSPPKRLNASSVCSPPARRRVVEETLETRRRNDHEEANRLLAVPCPGVRHPAWDEHERAGRALPRSRRRGGREACLRGRRSPRRARRGRGTAAPSPAGSPPRRPSATRPFARLGP